MSKASGCFYTCKLPSSCLVEHKPSAVQPLIKPVIFFLFLSLFLPCEMSEMFRHFLITTKTTQPCPQVFSVNRSIIWQSAARLTSSFTYRKILPNLTRAGYDELCVGFQLIRNGKIFLMNNNINYLSPVTSGVQNHDVMIFINTNHCSWSCKSL